jgi:putative peptidoglycan lipid II flippase
VDSIAAKESTGRHAFLVAAGILISRIVGLVRQRVFLYYFGLGRRGGRFQCGLRVPNFLQNLFGEGVLSASFIPVYARLLAKGGRRGGRGDWRAPSARILAVFTSFLVLIGVLLAPWLMVADRARISTGRSAS